jgi:CrcB protein
MGVRKMSLFGESVLVAIGGGLGAVARHTASRLAISAGVTQVGGIPLVTMAVNVVGCFLVGIVFSLLERHGAWQETGRLLLIVGFLGGFTTFSAFGLDAFSVIRENGWGSCLLFIAITMVSALLAVSAGRWFATYL